MMMDEKHGESSTPKDERRHSTTRYLRLNRLPTLQEVLDRRTRPPLDLFCFYIFLQRESAEDALDFWLDAQQHENLCKAYFKDLKKSGRTIDEDWPEFAHYARQNGSHFSPLLLFSDHPDEYLENGYGGAGRSSTSASRMHRDESGNNVNSLHQPDFSRTPAGSPLPGPTSGNVHFRSQAHQYGRDAQPASPALSGKSRGRRDTESHGHRVITPPAGTSGPTGEGNGEFGQGHGDAQDGTAHANGRSTFSRMSVRTWAQRPKERRSKAPTIIQRDRAIEKGALVESAERIYLRYLLGGAEKEIYLPPSLRIPDFPDSSSASSHNPSPLIPDLFHAQKVYIYRALEADAFPRFLRAKAFANLTPAGAFWRLVLGLVVLWGSFVTGFSLVFLAYPRRTRVWTILPFFIALNLLLSAYYSLSPLLALFQRSETSPFRTMRVREGYVRKLLAMRAAWIEAVCVVLTAVLACIFIFVPGHRL